MTLNHVPLGGECKILKISLAPILTERLFRLNVYQGAKVTLLGRSLRKKNILLESEGVRVGFSERIAECIEVESL